MHNKKFLYKVILFEKLFINKLLFIVLYQLLSFKNKFLSLLKLLLLPKNLLLMSNKLFAFILSWKISPLSTSDIIADTRKFHPEEKLKEKPQ